MRRRRPFVSISSAIPVRLGSADVIAVCWWIAIPSPSSNAEQHPGEFRVVARQRRCRLDDRDGGAEPAIGLPQLDPDRARPDNDEMLGQTHRCRKSSRS